MNMEEQRKLECKTGFKVVKKIKYLGVILMKIPSHIKIILLKYGMG